MQFALVDGRRAHAAPKLKGNCPICGDHATSKCGPRVIWHWAHASRRHCDPWWENETPWHRQWKSYFPEDWREVVHTDARGERHIADVKTVRGMVIEFQNSPMPPDELRARETFYGRMMWIVNGEHFKDRFHILSALPDPTSEFAQDLVFDRQTLESKGAGFWRKSENPEPRAPNALVWAHAMDEIAGEISAHYRGHHRFDWKHARTVWYGATAPVFLDFGTSILWRLMDYDKRGLRCVRQVRKRDVVGQNGGTCDGNGAGD